jgi:hypothetical protein
MIDLTDLDDFCGPNQGGINLLRLIPVQHIVSIPEPVQMLISEDILLEDGTTFYQVLFSENSGSYKETFAEEDNGEFFKQLLQVTVPKDRPAVAHFCDQLTGVRCVAIYQDANGYDKLIGSLEYPLTFKGDLETGAASVSRNGHTIAFAADSPHKAYFFTGGTEASPPTPEGEGVFDDTYDFTFQ